MGPCSFGTNQVGLVCLFVCLFVCLLFTCVYWESTVFGWFINFFNPLGTWLKWLKTMGIERYHNRPLRSDGIGVFSTLSTENG